MEKRLHELANYLLQNNKITPLKKLTKNNWSFRTKDSRFTYPQAGSIIKFIDEKYGREKLLTLRKDGNIQNSLGMSIEEFEHEWHKEIKQFSIEEIKNENSITQLHLKNKSDYINGKSIK